jgi:hypothetical protein
MGRRKREREGPGLGLERPPRAKPTQQPTENSTSNGADIWEEIRPWRNVGGERLPVDFVGYSNDEKNNEKIHLAAVEGHLTMKKYTTTNQSTVSVMGGGCVTRFDLDGTCGGDDIFVERQVGRSPFGTKKRSTEITSTILMQKS